MKEYKYTLHDGSCDFVRAEWYELDGTVYKFYVQGEVTYTIPAAWVDEITEAE